MKDLYRSTPAEIDMGVAAGRIRRLRFGRLWPIRIYGNLIATVGLSVLGTVVVMYLFRDIIPNRLSLVVLFVIYIIVGQLFHRRAMRKIRADPYSAGITEFRFDPAGFDVRDPAYQMRRNWTHVEDATTCPAGLLILFGGPQLEYMAVSASAFDGPEEMEQVAAQIRDWVAANRIDPTFA